MQYFEYSKSVKDMLALAREKYKEKMNQEHISEEVDAMSDEQVYQPIDQIRTGAKIKMMLKIAGYEVKDIQKYLHLSCPQSIYRWFKGKILPSVEHLCALSKLLNVHMEDLLVLQGQPIENDIVDAMDDIRIRRLFSYMKYLQGVA